MLTALAALLCILVAIAFSVGFNLAMRDAPLVRADAGYDERVTLLHQQFDIDGSVADAREQIELLSTSTGNLQARVARLESLAKHVARASGVDSSELRYDAIANEASTAAATDLYAGTATVVAQLQSLRLRIAAHEPVFAALRETIVLHRMYADTSPAGRPVSKGWVSSRFGPRIDPVSGRGAFHDGVDFAGRYKTPVLAVAKGIVSMAKMQPGYGNIVQVEHGDGLATRYAHNQKNLVKPGHVVRKGEVIALMGSTGRSTGTHVHFEVWRNGKAIDPMPFIEQKL